jgi:hypothetical protein
LSIVLISTREADDHQAERGGSGREDNHARASLWLDDVLPDVRRNRGVDEGVAPDGEQQGEHQRAHREHSALDHKLDDDLPARGSQR